jgi:hypothetical protein
MWFMCNEKSGAYRYIVYIYFHDTVPWVIIRFMTVYILCFNELLTNFNAVNSYSTTINLSTH